MHRYVWDVAPWLGQHGVGTPGVTTICSAPLAAKVHGVYGSLILPSRLIYHMLMSPAEFLWLRQAPGTCFTLRAGLKRLSQLPPSLQFEGRRRTAFVSRKPADVKKVSRSSTGQHALVSCGLQFSLTWKCLMSLNPSTGEEKEKQRESPHVVGHQQPTSQMFLLAFD